MITSIYYSGELVVQARVGVQVQDEADRLGKIISSIIQPVVQDFLRS